MRENNSSEELILTPQPVGAAECFLCEKPINDSLMAVFMGAPFHIECVLGPDPAMMDDLYEKDRINPTACNYCGLSFERWMGSREICPTCWNWAERLV